MLKVKMTNATLFIGGIRITLASTNEQNVVRMKTAIGAILLNLTSSPDRQQSLGEIEITIAKLTGKRHGLVQRAKEVFVVAKNIAEGI